MGLMRVLMRMHEMTHVAQGSTLLLSGTHPKLATLDVLQCHLGLTWERNARLHLSSREREKVSKAGKKWKDSVR